MASRCFSRAKSLPTRTTLFDSNGNVTDSGGKEIDPVDFSRLAEPLRHAIFEYVSRLVHFRTSHPALGVNDTDFIHVDFNDNKRVLVWKRGTAGQDPVVVVANFSDFATPNGLTDPERRIPGTELAGHAARPALARGNPAA